MKITYEAKHDRVGAFIPLHQTRRFIVVMYRDGKYADICGRFTNLKAAEKRAATLNATTEE